MNLKNFLIFDTSSPIEIWIGQLDESGCKWKNFQTEKTNALEGIFAHLENTNLINETPGFIFCEGPGSILGIRIISMALRAWTALSPKKPIYAFQSLNLAAAGILEEYPHLNDCTIFTESRLNKKNIVEIKNKNINTNFIEISDVDAENYSTETLCFKLPAKNDKGFPKHAQKISIIEIIKRHPDIFIKYPSLLTQTTSPNAINTSEPSTYAKWEAKLTSK